MSGCGGRVDSVGGAVGSGGNRRRRSWTEIRPGASFRGWASLGEGGQMSAVSSGEVAGYQTGGVEDLRRAAAEVEQSALTPVHTVGFAVLLVVVEVAWLALL